MGQSDCWKNEESCIKVDRSMKILILANSQAGLYRFRKELLEQMISKRYEVYVSVPEDLFSEELKATGCRLVINKYIDRRGTNPVKDVRLLWYYYVLAKEIGPNVILTYTIKPNIYGGLVSAVLKIPYIVNITGLGTSIENKSFLRPVILTLYSAGLRKAHRVFFQNQENLRFMLQHRIVRRKQAELLPGSGVNTDQNCYEPYPQNDHVVVFSVIGRLMKDKGTDEVIEAAEKIKKKYENIVIRLIGDYDENYVSLIEKKSSEGIIEYIPFQKEIHTYIANSHAVIHASYHEGMSNVLQEASSSGRPVLATDIPGCVEIIQPDITGIVFKSKSVDSLVDAIEKFLNLSHEEKEEMGKRGREKMIREFDRKIVVNKYMQEILSMMEDEK